MSLLFIMLSRFVNLALMGCFLDSVETLHDHWGPPQFSWHGQCLYPWAAYDFRPHSWYIWRSPFLVIMTPLCQQNQGTTWHNIQTLHNVFRVCIPFHSAHILLTYQRWLLPQIFCIFHTLMSLHRLFLPFYFSWQPLSIFYVYGRESSSSCFTVSSQRGGKCPHHSGRHLSDGTAPSLIIPDFLKTRRGCGS